jgi:hypothetical protein
VHHYRDHLAQRTGAYYPTRMDWTLGSLSSCRICVTGVGLHTPVAQARWSSARLWSGRPREVAQWLLCAVAMGLVASCARESASNLQRGTAEAGPVMDPYSDAAASSESPAPDGWVGTDHPDASFDVATIDEAPSGADGMEGAPDAPSRADVVDGADGGPSFGLGIYYRLPNLADPSALLTRVAPPLGSAIRMSPVGFDLRGDVLAFPYPAGLVVVNAAGQQRQVPVAGLYGIARPSLSPDGHRAAVQASATPGMPPSNLDIFVVSVDDGTYRKISSLPYNEESPAWFPQSNRVAYSSFSPTYGVNLHVYDLDLDKETLFVQDGGALAIAVSPDEKAILDFWRLREYDTATGAVVADLRAPIEAALPGTGYAMNTANPGRGGRTSFVLAGAYSPDGTSLVFDGTVTSEGGSGSVVFTTPLAAVSLTAATSLLPLQYSFSNGNNYSQLSPTWR